MISFGPIPSRRLGKSLGINNIPSGKSCTYSCVYCQVGLTKNYSSNRSQFYSPDILLSEIKKHIGKLDESNKPDFLTFVANGEPTLDINLGKSIEKLKTLNIPIAVITNASLLHLADVREELCLADWVSVKVDANNKELWQKINLPEQHLNFEKHIEGILAFSEQYQGFLATETMLVNGFNDDLNSFSQTSELIKRIAPKVAYLSIPTRPPAITNVVAPHEQKINEAYHTFSDKGIKTELLLGFEGTHTGYTGNAYEDIINICAVHPIREDTMLELLKKDNADASVLSSLLKGKYIKQVSYKNNNFYVRQYHTK